MNAERRGWYKQFQEYVLGYHWYARRNINELKLFLSGSYPCWVKPAVVRNLPGEIVLGLAGNAGISWDILQILAECRERDITDEECEYEKTNYFNEFYGYTGWNVDELMLRIASNPALPSRFISKWVKELPEYHSTLEYLARNPNTPIALLKQFASDDEWTIRSGVAGNKKIGKIPFKILADMLEKWDPRVEVAEVAATNPDMPPNYLCRLVTGGHLSPLAWYDAARNEKATASMLTWLSVYGGEQSEDILHEIAENPNTPTEIIEQLFNEGHYIYVAHNPNLPVKLLELFALDDEKYLRSTAARNPKTPPDLLEKLSHDKTLGADIAANPEAPVSLLRKLANHKYERIRHSVAGNVSSPIGVLKRLAQDMDVYVRIHVAKNLNLPIALFKTLAKDSSDGVRRAIALRVDTPMTVLKNMANDSSELIRKDVVTRKDTPKTVLEQLAFDRDAYVRRAVAKNPATPLSTLRSLLFDSDRDVCEAAAENPSAAMLFNSTITPDQAIEPELLQDIVRSRQPSLARFIAFLQPDCPGAALAKNSRSTEWRERCAIAMNPNTPPKTIGKLMDDENRIVRAAALSRNGKKH